MEASEQNPPGPDRGEGKEPIRLQSVMKQDVIRAEMDTTLSEAITICFQQRIRHLPVVNSRGQLAGLVTDRDLRYYISHRLGTIMENNADREPLHRHLHVLMVRRVITGRLDMPVDEAARLMVDNHIGCLPVVDAENRLLGIVTTGDLLRLIAHGVVEASLPASP
jgi:acetoin utilization protein AcuB